MGNVGLSEGRARRVARFLGDLDVPSCQIEETAFGDSRPWAANAEEHKPLNRRVEVNVRLRESLDAIDLKYRLHNLANESYKENLLELALFAANVRLTSSTLMLLRCAVCQVLVSQGLSWVPMVMATEAV
jgi:hypothetical protein